MCQYCLDIAQTILENEFGNVYYIDRPEGPYDFYMGCKQILRSGLVQI